MKTLSIEQFKKHQEVQHWNQKVSEILEYLKDQTGVSVLVRTCCQCNEIIGIKDGEGNFGIDSTYCEPCRLAVKEYLSDIKLMKNPTLGIAQEG